MHLKVWVGAPDSGPCTCQVRVGTLHLNIPTNHEWGKSHCILSQTTGQPRKVAIAHLGMRQYLFFNVSASMCHRASSASIIKSFWCGTNFLHQRLTSTICSLLKHFYRKFSMLLYSTVRRDSMDVNGWVLCCVHCTISLSLILAARVSLPPPNIGAFKG